MCFYAINKANCYVLNLFFSAMKSEAYRTSLTTHTHTPTRALPLKFGIETSLLLWVRLSISF